MTNHCSRQAKGHRSTLAHGFDDTRREAESVAIAAVSAATTTVSATAATAVAATAATTAAATTVAPTATTAATTRARRALTSAQLNQQVNRFQALSALAAVEYAVGGPVRSAPRPEAGP